MNPIISPWVFYAIDIADDIKWCAEASLIICVIAGAFLMIPWIVTLGAGEYDMKDTRTHERSERAIKKILVAMLISICVGGIFPAKNTSYKMLAASMVTPSNINAVQSNVVDFVDKIAGAIGKAVKEAK